MFRRPLPYVIVVSTLLVGVKTADLVHAIGIASPAHASTSAAKSESAPVLAHGSAKPAASQPAAPGAADLPPADPPVSETERATLQDLRARRKELDSQAAKLDQREALLTAAERRLTERVAQLTALQTKLETLEKQRQDHDDANWRGLVRTYENMRPREAAAIFNDLESSVLIQLLDRMKDAKAAPILAAMTPERARAATAQLAQWRNQASATPRIDGN